MYIRFTMVFLFMLLFSSIPVHAMEDETDGYQDERLNALELRLIDYESSIEELQENIKVLLENNEASYQEKLLLQQQIDVLIIGLDALYNSYLAECEKNSLLDEMQSDRYEVLSSELKAINTSLLDLKEISVSGNSLISDMNDNLGDSIKKSTEQTLTDLNETLYTTNKLLSYLFVILILFLVVFISIAFGKLIQHTLLKHMV